MAESRNPYKTFHSTCELLRKNIHIVLVRPEQSGNIGAAVRAIANMGISGDLKIVGEREVLPKITEGEAIKFARHAAPLLDRIQFFKTLPDAAPKMPGHLLLAATARIGSADRPHPLRVREAVKRAIGKLRAQEITDITFVFGPESSGLTNEDTDHCDWIVTIPSSDTYRSLNLAQAVLIFSYEANTALLEDWSTLVSHKPSQREKMVTHLLEVAEKSGFILPGDPFKMRPRLEGIFSKLPPQIPEAKTLHGLLDQVRRSLTTPDMKGRYKKALEGILDDGKGTERH
jgi:tRNA/rRNA methyltransferase